MKVGNIVRCIDNSDQDRFLTIGRTYEIDAITDEYLRIKDDSNEFYYYNSYRFILDIASERNKKLNKINERLF